MSQRIKAATRDLKELNSLEKSLTRLYNAGIFNTSEYKRLDLMIFDRQIKIKNFN